MESLFCFRKCNCRSLVVCLREETQANLLVMTTRMGLILAIAAVLLLSASGARAQSEITLLAPGPLGRETIDKLVANFEAKTGDKVKVTYGQGSRDTPPYGTRQLVARGQAQDVSIIFAPYPQAVNSGNVDRKTATTVARLLLGVTVKKGAPKPDISTPAALKKTLLAAKSIVIVDPAQGTLGGEAMDALKKLGIAEQVKPKMKIVEGSPVAEEMVAKGEAELFLGPQVSDRLREGVELVGGVPRSAATPVDAVGYVSTHAKDPKAAKALLAYLASPEAEAAYKAAGMLPGR
jgi:molybdate transport system substrate-binding protein